MVGDFASPFFYHQRSRRTLDTCLRGHDDRYAAEILSDRDRLRGVMYGSSAPCLFLSIPC